MQLQGLPMDRRENREEINKTQSPRIADIAKEHILPLLPAKSLCQYRAVCKEWGRWLSSPFLAHTQSVFFREVSGLFWQFPGYIPKSDFIPLRKTVHGVPDPGLNFLPEEVTMKTSCNGLICCRGLTNDSYYICNPVTMKWKLLPDPKYYHSPESAIILAFEPRTLNFTANYELFCAIPLQDMDLIMFEIFSSGSNSWRVSDTVCDELNDVEFTGQELYFHDVLYWEVIANSGSRARFILTFNARDEHYGIIQLPEAATLNGSLAVIQGEVCYIVLDKDPWEVHIYGGMGMRLRGRVSLRLGDMDDSGLGLRALACVKDGDVLLFLLGTDLISYCVSTGRAEVLSSDPMYLERGSRHFLYVNSLVNLQWPSPKDMWVCRKKKIVTSPLPYLLLLVTRSSDLAPEGLIM